MYYARFHSLRTFSEAEQREGNGRALGTHRLQLHSISTINLSSLPLLGYPGISTRKQLPIPMTALGTSLSYSITKRTTGSKETRETSLSSSLWFPGGHGHLRSLTEPSCASFFHNRSSDGRYQYSLW